MLEDKFGGKKAFLVFGYHRIVYDLGGYNKYTNIHWQLVKRLVFVCMGNINRSPYAEFKARALGMNSISCGINADITKSASIYALRNAKARNIDLSSHQCKSIHNINIEDGDLVLAMEPSHLGAIVKTFNVSTGQVTLLGAWADTPTPYIQDPICRSDEYYQSCFDVIDQSLASIKASIENAKNNN